MSTYEIHLTASCDRPTNFVCRYTTGICTMRMYDAYMTHMLFRRISYVHISPIYVPKHVPCVYARRMYGAYVRRVGTGRICKAYVWCVCTRRMYGHSYEAYVRGVDAGIYARLHYYVKKLDRRAPGYEWNVFRVGLMYGATPTAAPSPLLPSSVSRPLRRLSSYCASSSSSPAASTSSSPAAASSSVSVSTRWGAPRRRGLARCHADAHGRRATTGHASPCQVGLV